MTARPWSRQDILHLARGRFVVMYGTDWAAVPAPGWIVEASLGQVDANAASAQATCHPDDRRELLETFFAAQAQPGEPNEVTYRTNIRGAWARTTLTIVDLADHPDVGGVLCCALPGEPTDEPDIDL